MRCRDKYPMSETSLQKLKAQRDRLRQEVEVMEMEREIATLDATKGKLTQERHGPAAGAQGEPPDGSHGSRATSLSSPGSKR